MQVTRFSRQLVPANGEVYHHVQGSFLAALVQCGAGSFHVNRIAQLLPGIFGSIDRHGHSDIYFAKRGLELYRGVFCRHPFRRVHSRKPGFWKNIRSIRSKNDVERILDGNSWRSRDIFFSTFLDFTSRGFMGAYSRASDPSIGRFVHGNILARVGGGYFDRGIILHENGERVLRTNRKGIIEVQFGMEYRLARGRHLVLGTHGTGMVISRACYPFNRSIR